MDHQQSHHLYYDGSSCYQPPNFPGYFPLNCYTSLLPVPSPAHVSKDQLNGPPQHGVHHHQYNPALQLQSPVIQSLPTHKNDVVDLTAQKSYQVETLTGTHPPISASVHNIQHQHLLNSNENIQARYYNATNGYHTEQPSIWHQTPVAPASAAHPQATVNPSEVGKEVPFTSQKNVPQIPSRDDIVSKKLTCNQCNYSTFNKQTLMNHTAKHTGQGLHICPHCPFTSAYLGTYKRHMIRKHSDSLPTSPAKKQKDRISCPQCPFVTIYKKNMKKHMSKHTGEGLHKCPHCEYDTAYMAAFRKHMLKHNEEVSFPCSQCEYRAPAKGTLEKHVTSKHAEKLIYTCVKCNFTTSYKRSYKNHMIRHSLPFGKYECSAKDCTFSTDLLEDLKKHVSEHKSSSYQCRHCAYSTPFKGLFKFHLSSHVAEETKERNDCASENNRTESIQTVMLQPQHLNPMLRQQVYPQHSQNVSLVHSQHPQQQMVHHGLMPSVHSMHQMPHQSVMQEMHPITGHSGQNIQYAVIHQIPSEIKQHHHLHVLTNNENQQHNIHSVQYSNASSSQSQQMMQLQSTECGRKQSLVTKQKKEDDTHDSEVTMKLYKCKECAYTTILKNDLRIHKVTHKGKGLHTCPECPFTTAYRGTFKRHMSKHSKGVVYECTLCDYKSAWKGFFDRHMESKHNNPILNDDCSPHQDSILVKESCNQPAHRSKKSKRVDITVDNDSDVAGRLQCEHCSYSTDLSSTFKRHSSKHLKEKCFTCLHCSYSADCLTIFNRHIVKHSDVNCAFSCPHCMFKSSTQQNIDDHLSRKHKRSTLRKKKRRKVRKVKPDPSDDEDFFPPELQLAHRSTATRRKFSSSRDSPHEEESQGTVSNTVSITSESSDTNTHPIYNINNLENGSHLISPSKSCLLQFTSKDNCSKGSENAFSLSSSSHARVQDIPIEVKNTTIEAQNIPVEAQNTPVEALNTPVEALNTPNEAQNTPNEVQNIPVETQTRPSLEQTTPSLEQTTPSLEQTKPSLEQTKPSLEQTMPSMEQTTPSMEQTTPSMEQTMPSMEQTTPDTFPKSNSSSHTHNRSTYSSPHTGTNESLLFRQSLYFHEHC